MRAVLWFFALLTFLAIWGLACGDRGSQEATPSNLAQPTAVARASLGCSRMDDALYRGAGSSQALSLQVDGIERQFFLYIPAQASRQEPIPLVYNFHGLGSNAKEQELYSQLLPVAAKERFIVVSPEGLGPVKGWRLPGLSGLAVDDPYRDVRFFDALHSYLVRSLCVDEARVYATGMSNGAFFSSMLACLRPETLAAIAPVAGVFYPSDGGCKGEVPVIAFHGTQDQIVPFQPGLIFSFILYEGAKEYVARWAQLNGCQGEPLEERLGREVVRLAYPGCEASTQLVVIEGGGHTWPGSFPVPQLGYTTQEISAAAMLWDFFAQHRRP